MIAWLEENMYVALGVLVLLALLAGVGSYAGHLSTKNGELQVQLKQSQHDRDQANLNLTTLQRDYSTLDGAHKQCMDEIRVASDAQAQSLAALSKVAQNMQQETENVRALHETIFKAPGCKELAELDVAGQCPALGVSLRQRAALVSAPREN